MTYPDDVTYPTTYGKLPVVNVLGELVIKSGPLPEIT